MDPRTPRLGQMLLHHRLLAGGQILECLELQTQRTQSGGRVVPLGTIALEKGYLSPDQLNETLYKQSLMARGRVEPQEVRRPPGRLREEFQILRTLGRDGHFSTFQAVHSASGAMVALRVLDSDAEGPESSRLEGMARSVDALQRLQHPGLQPLVGGGRMGPDLYFAAEYLEAVSLHRLLRSGAPLDWRWGWDLAVQVASALEYAHGEKCFHGGVRPSNILIGRGGRAVLAHLGLVLSERENTLALLRSTGRTPIYLAPEQIESDQSVGTSSDLYSLGASLYHALTGCAPRTAATPEEFRAALTGAGAPDPLDLNPGLPAPFARILLRLISPDPEERYPTAWELLNDLSELKPLVEQSPGLATFQAGRNALIDSTLEETVPAPPLPGPAVSPAAPRPGRRASILASAVVPILSILFLTPALTFVYRHVYAHRVFLLQGEHLYFRRDMDGALAKFRKAQSLRPDLPALQERILSFALETKDYALAFRQIDLLRALRPEDEKTLRLLRTDILLWSGEAAAALAGYREFARLHGDDLEIRLRIAQAQAAGRELNEALASYADIHASHPEEPRALLEMARLSSALGQHDQSRRLYGLHLRQHGEAVPVLVEYARSLEACRDFEEAAKAYERLGLLTKDDGEHAFARARALLWSGDAEAACRILLERKERAVSRPEWGITLARAHESLREFAKAESVWKELAGLYPARLDLALELGRLYERTGQFDRALVHLRAALKRFGPSAELLASLGRTHAARKEPKEALPLFLRAARLEPGNRSYPLEVARTLIWLERPQEALETLHSLGAQDLLTPEIEVERARVYFRLGLRAEASAILGKLAASVKEDSPFLKPLGELELEGTTEPGKARLYETYLRKHPEDVDSLRRFSQLLRASGDHARAWPLYRKRLEIEPRTPELVLEASEEASWAGDPESAIRLLEGIRRPLAGTK